MVLQVVVVRDGLQSGSARRPFETWAAFRKDGRGEVTSPDINEEGEPNQQIRQGGAGDFWQRNPLFSGRGDDVVLEEPGKAVQNMLEFSPKLLVRGSSEMGEHRFEVVKELGQLSVGVGELWMRRQWRRFLGDGFGLQIAPFQFCGGQEI